MSDALCDGVLSVLEDTKVSLSLEYIHQKVGMSFPISEVEVSINHLCAIGIVKKVDAKYICTSDLEQLSPPQQVRKGVLLPVNPPVEQRTDVSGNLSLLQYLLEGTTQGSPRTTSGQIVPRGVSPVAAVKPITRSRKNDQVERRADVSGNLSLSPYLRDRTTQGSPRTTSGQIVPLGVSSVAASGPITRSRKNDQEQRTDVSGNLSLLPYLLEGTTQGSPRTSSGQIVPRGVSPVAAVKPITRSRKNDQERRTDVSGNLSLSPYLRDRTTLGSPRTTSGQIVPRASGPIPRSRINDQVTLCSENLPIMAFPGRELRIIEISDEVKQLLRILKEAPGPLKAMQAATKAGINEKKRCNQLLYYFEAKGLVEKSGTAWKLCSRPEVSEEDILAYSSELYVKHEANKTPPVNEANDSASAQQGGLHLHVHYHNTQVGNNNIMNIMYQNNRSGRQSE